MSLPAVCASPNKVIAQVWRRAKTFDLAQPPRWAKTFDLAQPRNNCKLLSRFFFAETGAKKKLTKRNAA